MVTSLAADGATGAGGGDAGSVAACAHAAAAAAAGLAAAPGETIDEALLAMAALLREQAPAILAANRADTAAGQAAGLGAGLLDRLRLDDARLAGMSGQLTLLAGTPFPPGELPVRDLPG